MEKVLLRRTKIIATVIWEFQVKYDTRMIEISSELENLCLVSQGVIGVTL
jgi:hypothetical protein